MNLNQIWYRTTTLRLAWTLMHMHSHYELFESLATTIILQKTITKNNIVTKQGIELLVVLALGFEPVSVGDRSFAVQLKERW